jgi:hypothetical protein
MKFRTFAIASLFALSFVLAASAANEATYSPGGLLSIPHLNLLDAAGNPIASYEVTMQKESNQWRFELATVTDLPLSIPEAGGESILSSSGRLYIPHAQLLNSQGQTIRNYAVYLRKDSHWRFTIYGLTDLDAASGSTDTGSTDTNTTTNVISDVAGTWDFTFGWQHSHTFSGTEFESANNMTPSSFTIPMTLEQTDEDVTGTGTADSVEYTLSGQVSGDLFSFTLLAGYTDQTMGLLSTHAVVDEEGYMAGDYYRTITNNTSTVQSGEFDATKQ